MYERTLVTQLRKRMLEKRHFVQCLTGPRQTGKTTAVLQALETMSLPYHFISTDDASIISREFLSNEWQRARLLTKNKTEEALLVVDEIQKIPSWSSVVKALWDEDSRNNMPLKVLLTGSSAMLLQKGMEESLMGRYEVIYSPHWSYPECRDAFGYTLDDFLFFGGFPGAQHLREDETRWARYIGTSIVEPTLSLDVLAMEEVRKPALLRALFMLGASFSAQELSYTKMIGQLQDAGNTVTLASYLELLSKAHMLCGLQKFDLNILKTRKSSPRLMVYDTALMTYASGTTRRRLLEDPSSRGHLVESAVGANLLARSREEGFEVFWWRERNKEVDFVIQKGSQITAIEVKSGRLKNLGGSHEFLKIYPEALFLVVGGPNCSLEDFLSDSVPLF